MMSNCPIAFELLTMLILVWELYCLVTDDAARPVTRALLTQAPQNIAARSYVYGQ